MQLSLERNQLARTQGNADINKIDDFLKVEMSKSQDFFRIQLNQLSFQNMIGTGASAEVFKGVYKEIDVAIKKLRFTVTDQYGP